MLIFKKYPSLENSDREKIIAYMQETRLDVHEYIVQEKIHGSNLCLITNGKQVQTAKRSGFLSPEDIFFNHQAVLEKYEVLTLQIFEKIKTLYPETETIAVFGEIFGGLYPHAEVASEPTALRCQKHIYYSPVNDFCAFDILRDSTHFLDYDMAEHMFKDTGFLYAPALARGNLAVVLDYNPVFPTTLPERLGYPVIPGNMAEGIVIKPAFPSQWESDAYRFCLKQKNPAYREKIKGGAKPVGFSPKANFSPALRDLIEEGLAYVTESRYGSVASKLGCLTLADHGRTIEAYAEDLLSDFLKDHENAYDALQKTEQKQWRQSINKAIAKALTVWITEHAESSDTEENKEDVSKQIS